MSIATLTVKLQIVRLLDRRMSSAVTCLLKCRAESIKFFNGRRQEIEDAETEKSLRIAANHLVNETSPIAFPTETVYGLGANALNEHAVAQIFKAKGRPADNPLIVHISSLEMLSRLVPENFQMPPIYTILINKFWPGPLSLLFPSNPVTVPSIVTANHSTVAVRMPSSPVARALINFADTPLAAPSANSSGSPSPTRADHVYRDLNGKIPYILDSGPCSIGLESTVADGLSDPSCVNILRPGGITVEDIESCLHEAGSTIKIRVHRRDYQDENMEQAPTTPGMKYRHYSPRVPVFLFMAPSTLQSKKLESYEDIIESLLHTNSPRKSNLAIGLLLAEDSKYANPPHHPSIIWHHYSLGKLDDVDVMASRLFDGLLTLEERQVDLIFAESIEETKMGLAFMNRLTKAATEIHWMR